MSLTYSTFVTSLANMLPVTPTNAAFVTVLPNIIDDAELRIYRDLDLLNTVTVDATGALTAGSRVFSLPSANGTFVVTEEISVISPASATAGSVGSVRNQLTPASKELLNALWPSVTGSTVPSYFAMRSQSTVWLGPWPDQAYSVEVVGTIRPNSMSSTNATTLLSVYYPDLLLAASMVFAAGYQKNFGAAVDDPKSAVTWEGHYQSLLADAKLEEMKKKRSGGVMPGPMPART